MDELSGVKSELKKWESAFLANQGRKPLKEDIESAGDEVKSLYKKYDKLKRTKAIPVWGKELNKSLSELKASNPDDEEETENFRMSISKKFIDHQTLAAPGLKIKTPSVHLAPSTAYDSKENKDFTSFDSPTTFRKNNLKLKFNTPNGLTAPMQRINSPLVALRRSGIRNEYLTSLPLVSGNISTLEATPKSFVDEVQQPTNFMAKEVPCHSSPQIVQVAEVLSSKTNLDVGIKSLNSDHQTIAVAQNFSLPLSSDVQIPAKDDVVVKAPAKAKARSTKRKRKGNDEDDDAGNHGDDNNSKAKKMRMDAEDEFVDRNIESIEDVRSDAKADKKNITWRKPREEYSSKISKDNFVRLNMKVKKYKKKGGISAVSVRRQIWKEKLRMKFGGSKGGSSGSCFKCGQSGHWAKNCKNQASQRKEFDWTMGSQNAQPSDQSQNAFEKVDVGQCASKALEQVSFFGDVTHERYEPFRSVDHVQPMLEPELDGSLPEVPAEVSAALKKFGFRDFREGQKEAVMNILCGKSTLVVLSTGSGKSLCYQLPAYLYAQRSKSICLVVSPLVSLMQDQVLDLPACLKGACIHNNMTADQRQKVLELASEGQLHFLLLSPEMLVGGFLSGTEGRGLNLPPVSFACVDEVHCLSDWSHHFRPSYLMICKVLRERFGVKCFLGLTATANRSAIISICQHFEIEQNDSNVIRQAPVPRNLLVTISRDENKEEMLIHLLKGQRFSRCQSIIVYCTRREQTSRVAVLIRTRMQNEVVANDDDDVAGPDVVDNSGNDDGAARSTVKGKARKPKKAKAKKPLKWDAECYHAGLTAVQRKRIQKNFMSGKLRVVVATVAFGMGLDKSDVRGIIHFNLPGTVESYIQEIGRAGRDGVESHCHLFLDSSASDLMELKRHIHAKSLDRITVKKLVQQVFKPCKCRLLHEVTAESSFNNQGEEIQTEITGNDLPPGKRICPGHERALSIDGLVNSLDVKEEGLSTLLCYLELCPQKWICNRHPVYSRCSIRFYSAQNEFSDLLKKCPALGVLLAKRKDLLASLSTSRSIDFDVVELSDSVGSQSSITKRQLRDLQYISDQNGCRRSGIVVEFTDLSFHFQAPGDLLDEEVDSVVDALFERVQGQESAELYHLHKFYDMLNSVSYKSCFSCQDEVDKERSFNLRKKLQNHLESGTDQATLEECKEVTVEEIQPAQEASLRQDVRSFVNTYSGDHRLTGRSIARIFHGIHSPCFPSETWSKVRRFWRSHMDVDFNLLRKIATSELTSR